MNWMYIYYASLISMLSVTKVYAQCSGSALCIDLTTTYTGSISSPGYGSGGYSANQNCSWHIEGFANGLMYHLTRDTIHCSDGVYIYEGLDDSGQLLNAAITCNSGDVSQFVSNGTIFVQFISDSTNQGGGFELKFASAPENVGNACSGGQNLTASSTKQVITSSNFPDKYTGDENCYWYINSENGKNIQLEILFMNIEEARFDYLNISDGQGNLITRFDNSKPPDIQKRTFIRDGFVIYLETDSGETFYGILISYVTVETITGCTYPEEWQTNTVNDNYKGLVTFTNTTLTGWYELSYGTNYSDWTCYQRIGDLIISRSERGDIEHTDNFNEHYSYLCMQIESSSNNDYSYKLLSARDSNSANARLVLIQNGFQTNFPSDCNEEYNTDVRTITITEDITAQVTETTTVQETTSIPSTTSTQMVTTTQQQMTTSTPDRTTQMSTSTQETLTTTTATEDCTYPLLWQTNTMNDSVEGVVTFTNTTITGWSETSSGETYDEWTCYQKIGNLIISRSLKTNLENTNVPGVDYSSYMCMQIESVSNNVYSYKLLSEKHSNSANARLVLIQSATIPDFPSACKEESHNETRTLSIIEDATTQVIQTTTAVQETTTSILPTTTTQMEATTQEQFTTSTSESPTISTSTQNIPTTTASASEDCTYPLLWQTYTMNDSIEGVVTFTNTTITGWSETSSGDTYDEWTCYQKIGNLIISRSLKSDLENTNDPGVDYSSYMCMQIESVSNNVYSYKLLSEKHSNSANARLVLIPSSTTPIFPSACKEESHNEIRTLTVIEETTTQHSTETTAQETTSQSVTTAQELTTSVSVMTTSTEEPSQSTTTTVTTTKEDTTTDSTMAQETTSDMSTTTVQQTTSDMSITQKTTLVISTTAQETTSDMSITTAQETTFDMSTTTVQETTSDMSTTTAQETTSDMSTTKAQETTSDVSTATAQETTSDISTTTGVTTTISDISTTTAGQTTTGVITTTSAQATTTTQHQSTPSIIDSTSTQETQSSATTTATSITTTQEVSTLSSAAQIAVIAGTVGGVAVLFLLAALVIVIIFSCCRKPRHRRLSSGPSSGPDDRQPDSQDESVPSWVHMVDNLYQNGYSPYFYNDFKSGKFSGESLNRV